MSDYKFSGVFTALITPFNDQGEVDYSCFESIVHDQIKKGIHGLVVCGTTAESPCLSEEESTKLIEIAVRCSKGKIPVIAGVGSNNTEKTCANAVKAEALGVDGILVIAPYYNKPSGEGIVAHFREIDSKVNIPIIVYNHPGRTGVDVNMDILEKLSKLKNVAGIKDVSGDLSRVLDVQSRIGKDFAQFSGDDMSILPFYSHGGHGVISVASNILPAEMVAIHDKVEAGDFHSARRIYKEYYSLVELLGCETNPVPVKYCAQLLGICSEKVRLPLVILRESNKKLIEQEIKKEIEVVQ